MTMSAKPPLELWGGLECSIIRVGDDYRDQFRDTGHYDRPQDLDAVADLGIRTIRYPVLWEAVSPHAQDDVNFDWHDERLERLKKLEIEPIIGLMHHGSGPRCTDLLDRRFPELLAAHAARVAARYPHIRYFTPLNEPLTTARFSALYGVWYPHKSSMCDFARALINQCRAIMLAMRAIRAVNPHAKLVQTEDMGKTFSTARLKYQADHENERRWLSLDLLFGHVTAGHPWYRIFMDHGIEQSELDELSCNATPPDIVGINYYLTSERFLDHRKDRWPDWQSAGGNGRHRYADLEAVRTHIPSGDTGLAHRLREVWERYSAPIAITESHLGCSRDEQLRWLSETWRTALRLRNDGIELKAVTLWSMFGSMDWNSLMQRRDGCYEPGAFDIRDRIPRPTALAAAAAAICRDGDFDHPVLDTPGWWHRPDRFYRIPAQKKSVPPTHRRALVVAAPDAPLTSLQTVLGIRGMDSDAVNLTAPIQSELWLQSPLGPRLSAWAIILLLTKNDDPSAQAIRAVATDLGVPMLIFRPASHGLTLRHASHSPLQISSCLIFPHADSRAEPAGGGNVAFRKMQDPGCAGELRASSLPDLFHLGLDLLLDRGGSSYEPQRAA